MSPWGWWAGELDDDVYNLAGDLPTREEVIQAACRELKPGDRFRIIEARSSSDRRYEGQDFVPFMRTRNLEIVMVGPVPATEVGR